jgi:hypothetical protein
MMKLPVPSERLTVLVGWGFLVLVCAAVAWLLWEIVT